MAWPLLGSGDMEVSNEGPPGGHILVWERDPRPPGWLRDTCDDSREPSDKDTRTLSGGHGQGGFSEDGVVRAEAFRFSGREPTRETE